MVLVYNKNLDFVVVEEVGSFMVFMVVFFNVFDVDCLLVEFFFIDV